MGETRKNIKVAGEVFKELNDLRKELDREWTPFLRMAVKAIRIVYLDEDTSEETDDEMTRDELADIIKREHEATRSRIPEETANELAERF